MSEAHKKQVNIEERASAELNFSERSANASRLYGKCVFCGRDNQEVGMFYTCLAGPSFEATVYFCLPCLREVAGDALTAEVISG